MSDKISALLDGEFEEDEALEAIRTVLSNQNAIKTTRDYQLIGDAMRGEQVLSTNLSQSIMDKIELEPTILSPNATKPLAAKTHGQNRATDNASIKKRLPQGWSIAASVAAVAAVGMLLLDQNVTDPELNQNMAVAMHNATSNNAQTAIQIAKAPSIPAAYLRAHRVSVPSVGSHYIQTVNFSE